MVKVAFIIALVAFSIKFPFIAKYLLATPILAFMVGGFAWCVAGAISPEFVSFNVFACFVASALLPIGIFVSWLDA